MGLSYRNIVLRGTTQHHVVTFLRRADWHGVVSPTVEDITVVYLYYERFYSGPRFDDGIENYQLPMTFVSLVMDLSRELACAAFGVDIGNDDFFRYLLVISGVMMDYYIQPALYLVPETADLPWDQVVIDTVRPPRGGNAGLLCDVFGVPNNTDKVAAILNFNELEDDKYAFESSRHHDVVDALGLPETAHMEIHSAQWKAEKESSEPSGARFISL